MTSSSQENWLIPAGLLTLSLIPVAAGVFGVVQIGGGAAITAENARFFEAPLPIVLHVLGATVYCVLGAFQFSPGLRRRKPIWHRASGRMLVPCGLVAALSGIWLAHRYQPVSFSGPVPADYDGSFLYAIRVLVGLAMTLSLCLGVAAVRRGDLARHQKWMMRAYALSLGAGTQVVTHLPWFLIPSLHSEMVRTLFMGAAWAINLAVVEWLILRNASLGVIASR